MFSSSAKSDWVDKHIEKLTIKVTYIKTWLNYYLQIQWITAASSWSRILAKAYGSVKMWGTNFLFFSNVVLYTCKRTGRTRRQNLPFPCGVRKVALPLLSRRNEKTFYLAGGVKSTPTVREPLTHYISVSPVWARCITITATKLILRACHLPTNDAFHANHPAVNHAVHAMPTICCAINYPRSR